MKTFTLPRFPPTEKLLKLPLVEKWANLSLTYRALLTLGIIVLLLATYISLVYLPQEQKRDNLEMEIRNMESQLANLKRKAKDKERLQAELAEKKIKLRKIIQQLPDQKEIPNLLTDISNAGRESGLEFLVFKPKPEIQKEFYAEIPIDICVSGSYHNVATFLDRISKLPRIICVTDLSMGEARPSEQQMILKTKCVMTTYRYVAKLPEEGQRKKGRKK
ncbi:MAG TPA: hypothetical protein EYP21_03540 [Syntrophaceae bacterium]|nr:hypothetical protein [Syntrophaceae bacterium]